jgi:hypothetical protein
MTPPPSDPAQPRPEIPPPPNVPSMPPISVRGPGWRASVPSALVIAVVTTMGTAGVTRCTEDPTAAAEQRRQFDHIARRLDAIEAGQRAVLDRVERDATAAANRDAIQNVQLEALRNR